MACASVALRSKRERELEGAVVPLLPREVLTYIKSNGAVLSPEASDFVAGGKGGASLADAASPFHHMAHAAHHMKRYVHRSTRPGAN